MRMSLILNGSTAPAAGKQALAQITATAATLARSGLGKMEGSIR
jgi:hypothetical protein